ncbi:MULTISPECIES: SusC/RagA family TonB-linked outer membrane protein [unclassified Cellulophaga]|uniref:SusC/RagA family TonB-linked outer membrane protein n=1 Tax=unclassified Cellulophaga TaxID=2634405 RepID=UPI0026E4742C|nr:MULTISPECIES: SusC/RagA family TonB-linked outer membrane protein [unclassified Cellulophaga]MDO6490550.1 SusC/RagA family TonB-linked outer membrane protein [Cellulophaga sp. 2_MG-2023]MDO6494256.1 SusC/RagA family TonB-linked outer membrane protein [Cellulophaga sp. 3_MG-2023]
MKTKQRGILTLLLAFIVHLTFAQQKTVSGTVTDQEGVPLPGVNILVEGTTTGTQTDFDGKYSISASNGQILLFTYLGQKPVSKTVTEVSTINVQMQEDSEALEEVVVTALGIKRSKKSLGYATQKVSAEEISTIKESNVLNQLSGKVAGLSVQRTNNLGGSTNVVIRGQTSLTGSNQALFVIDGVPVSNRNTNTGTQSQGATGYDYGNPISDINPDDIESMNVLKGAAATALYGSRASNGVIVITTKKGTRANTKDYTITLSSNASIGSIDKSTFPKFQQGYGAGYGGNDFNFAPSDFNGDGTIDSYANYNDDASFGPAFDSNLMLLQWDALYPQLTDTYGVARPWEAAKNGPLTFFNTPTTFTNSVSVAKRFDNDGSFRLSYSNFDAKGILPNSSQKKNTFSLATTAKLTDKLEATGFVTYINSKTVGRNSTGYNDNIVGFMRQWGQNNVDFKRQKDAYFQTGDNITWNPKSPTDLTPAYWDNPYWTRYENYQNDGRNRFTGYAQLKYQIAENLSLTGKAAVDQYSEIQEERRAVGSVPTAFGINEGPDGSYNRSDQQSGYLRRNINSRETNLDLLINYSKDITENLSFSSFIGGNVRNSTLNMITAATNGGLKVPGVYSLQNTTDALPNPKERDETIEVQSFFAGATFGYKDFLFLEGTLRRDKSSTLPASDNSYYYPAVSGSYLFSKNLNVPFIKFAKLRANWAQIGNDTGFDQINDTYTSLTSFQGNAAAAVSNSKKNPTLKPEISTSYELGLEMRFLEKANLGFDIAYYKTNTTDQIVPVSVSETTGYTSKVINAGELENKGIEFSAFSEFDISNDFKWKLNVNWSKNESEVISLAEGLDELLIGSFGVQVVAKPGEAYGALKGTDYTYNANGQRIIGADGKPVWSDADQIIGNGNPDWLAGVRNTFTYKNLALSVFVDIRSGGDMYSLDQRYGQATGVLGSTSYINDLGNPVRNTLANGGGFIYKGVLADGTPNTKRLDASGFGNTGYQALPLSEFVYDASFVKLREVSLSYNFAKDVVSKLNLDNLSLTLVGSNLWIIHKNIPGADPETGFGSGNIQGISSGSLPTTKNVALNLKLQF